MRANRIKIIIIVMTTAVLGLVAVQVYWITNAIKVEEEKFERKVYEALLTASSKLERKETANVITKKIVGRNAGTIIIDDDTLKSMKFNKNKPITEIKIISSDSSSSKLNYQIMVDSKVKSNADKKNVFEKNIVWREKKDTFMIKRKQLVEDVVTELIEFGAVKKLEDRISEKQIDSLISTELTNRGINTEYFYGVNKVENDSLVFLKKGTDIKELQKSSINILLFSEGIFDKSYRLKIYFPNKDSFLISSIAGMLFLSAFLLVVVIGVFYKTIKMFLDQKKLSDVKDDLINNITHEFKTPISTISLACEALQEPELTNELKSVNKYAGIIKDENEKLRMMVENFLDTAAIEKGVFQIKKEVVDINNIVQQTSNKYLDTINTKRGSIHLNLMPNVPKIVSDKFHLGNVLKNIIDNAIKYNENYPMIEIKTESGESEIKITVKDNGIGISQEQQKKIFDTFYRVSSGNIHNVHGNGIGLSYSKNIIAALGGKISVSSKLGEGSTFEITLPIKEKTNG